MNAPLPRPPEADTPPLAPPGEAITRAVRLRARLLVRWLRALWADADPTQGLAIPHEEVDRALADPPQRAALRSRFLAADPEAEPLLRAAEAEDARLAAHPSWRALAEAFGLTQAECALLALALAVELDPELRRVCGYLHDDAAACHASRWLAASLFAFPDDPGPLAHIAPSGALVRWRLARPGDSAAQPWSALAPWQPDPTLVAWAQGTPLPLEPGLVPYGDETASLDVLHEAEFAALMGFARAASQGVPALIELTGQLGSGRRTLAAQLCARLGAGMLAIDLAAITTGEAPGERLRAALRTARLAGAVPCWHGAAALPPGFWDAIGPAAPLMIFVADAPMALAHPGPCLRHHARIPLLRRPAQLALWQGLTGAPPPAPIQEWQLLPGDIVAAVMALPHGQEAVIEACRGRSAHAGSELFAHLATPYTWDDIILPPALRQHLAELEQQARLRNEVYEDWGFERLCPMGRGITAMFAGPSGTGKTMAAQVMARTLGMELYRVDLAGVMNKYIGETEKRLKQVFEVTERGNVLLFFDEADALFGQRTQVKDAHDRFANIEIDYLLQRMEQFDGIAVLATNRKNDLDKAFLRRIRFIIDFMNPGTVERLALWRRVLPAHAPDGAPLLEDIDFDLLAQKLSMTGAEITLTGLNAAFAARGEGSRIAMRHVLRAARRELTKQGIMLRAADFGGGVAWPD